MTSDSHYIKLNEIIVVTRLRINAIGLDSREALMDRSYLDLVLTYYVSIVTTTQQRHLMRLVVAERCSPSCCLIL